MMASFRHWRWIASLVAISGGGCAGGTWLERPLAAEFPVDAPPSAYPTAIRAGETKPASTVVTASISDDGPATAPSAEQAQSPETSVPNTVPVQANAPDPRLSRQQAHMPVLAVVPPQLIASSPRPAAPAAQPVAAPDYASALAPEPAAEQPMFPGGLTHLAHFDHPSAAVDKSVAPPTNATLATTQAAPGAEENPVAQTSATTVAGPALLEKKQSDLIDALESEIRRRREAGGSDEELPRLEQQLRLAYVAGGRLDDAVSAVESLDPAQQEAYKNLMFGLGVWLSPDEARRAPLRTAKVLHSLRDATTDLAASSKLELRNLVFCERVDYFGWYTEFPRKEFQPKQQVILYVEVQNFAAEQKGPAGFETELQGSYEILDSGGQIIASRQLPLDKEICRNYRKDYFLAYRIYMPDNIAPGHYRLELTVEDLKAKGKYQGRKLGEGMIEFSVR